MNGTIVLVEDCAAHRLFTGHFCLLRIPKSQRPLRLSSIIFTGLMDNDQGIMSRKQERKSNVVEHSDRQRASKNVAYRRSSWIRIDCFRGPGR